jgi:HYR domain/FG-GAP repeat
MLTRTFFRIVSGYFAALLSVTPALHAQQESKTLKHAIPSPPVGVQSGPELGRSVAVDGNFTIVGAPQDTTGGHYGVVKVFDSSSGALLHVLLNPSASTGQFGYSVAISGTIVVVGAWSGGGNPGRAYVYDLASGSPTVPFGTLNDPSFNSHSGFGLSVAIFGDLVIVGAPYYDRGWQHAGRAYVYNFANGVPTSPAITLENPTPWICNQFGNSVAIAGTRVVVAAPNDVATSPPGGLVHVYDLSGETPTTPALTLHGSGLYAEFGWSVAISGVHVVVGAYGDHLDGYGAGRAYVFDVTSGTPTIPVVTLKNPDPTGSDFFGWAVSISGMRVIVGAQQDDAGATNAGSAYVYDLSSGTPTIPVVTLNNPDPRPSASFGTSVAIRDTRVVVGVPNESSIATDAGCAYSYDLTSGSPATPVAPLKAPSPAEGDAFGSSIAISGKYAVVGAPYEDTGRPEAGTAYVYDLSSSTPALPVVTLHNPNPLPNDAFGNSVAISGTLVVVGAYFSDVGAPEAGIVYVYDLAGTTPTVPIITLSNPSPQTNDFFGSSVAISGRHVVVGAPYDDTVMENAGSAYVYDLDSVTPAVPIVTLNNSASRPGDYFGASVAISGARVVVGADHDRDYTAGLTAGSAFVFDLSTPTPTVPLVKFRNPSPEDGDQFGSSVAISGVRVVVGSPRDNTGAQETGNAYVFDLTSQTPTAPIATLNNPFPGIKDYFGTAVGIFGTNVVVSAPNHGVGGASAAGSVYMYSLTSSVPAAPVAVLNNPDPGTFDLFGGSIAIEGTTVAAGVPGDGSVAAGKGYAYIFEDTATNMPILVMPASNAAVTNPVSVEFALSETALPGSLILHFNGLTNHSLTLAGTQETFGTHSFPFDPANPTGAPQIADGMSIPDGTYTVTLVCQDAFGNPTASTTAINVTIDTKAPQISAVPADMTVIATGLAGAVINYASPTAFDEEGVVSFIASNASGETFPIGVTTVTFTASDAANNTTTASFKVTVRPAEPLTRKLFAQGDDAPGAGTLFGPPPGAKLAEFGVPAIDADGHVAFTATWTGSWRKRVGLFRDDACVAIDLGPVPGTDEGTFKSFTDPLIDGGNVAFMAIVSGVPRNYSAGVFSNAPTGELELIAQAGTYAAGTGTAPGIDEATFKSFKRLALAGNAVAILAELTPGTGSNPKTTVSNDLGLWVKRGSDALVLLLRQGQEVAPGKVIKKLISFAGGNGSPGQGRGWLLNGETGMQVHVLATFTDRSEAIIAVPLDDVTNPVILSQSGIVGGPGSPSVPGGSFASYSLPAANSANSRTFLASITVSNGNGARTKSRGIFADFDGSGTYTPVVRTGDLATQRGAVFAAFKDQVIAADGSVAFAATLKGPGVDGLNRQTLWWQPPGGVTTLLAQAGAGGVMVPGLPGARWKTFSSLAIASVRCPIFTATLEPGRGGVTHATSKGVWALDLKGDLRLLFQTGVTQVDGKTVKSFTLLNAVPTAPGNTRSFNDKVQVAWRATFEDNSQAIVMTEVP